MFKHIVIATDGSNFAQKAVVQGIELAKHLGAKVSVLAVTEPWWSGASGYFIPTPSVKQAYEQLAEDSAAKIGAFASETAKQQGMTCAVLHIKDRHPVDGIIEGAEKNGCDLIVVGARGYRALERFLLGSVTTAVVARSSVPVLVSRSLPCIQAEPAVQNVERAMQAASAAAAERNLGSLASSAEVLSGRSQVSPDTSFDPTSRPRTSGFKLRASSDERSGAPGYRHPRSEQVGGERCT